MTRELRFSLLGPVRGWSGDAELDLGRPQQREVLAVLLGAAGRTVAMPLLVDGVWDEGDRPARPEHAIRTHIWRLRRALDGTGAAVLETVGDGYALRVAEHAVDTWSFQGALATAEEARSADGADRAREVLDEALALWAAEPLAGLHGPAARAARTRLRGVRQALLEARLELDAELGDRPGLAAEAGALVVEYPASQRLRGVQMLALYRSGRQAEALGVFEDTRRYLGTARPDGALRELHRRILRSDPSLRLPGPAHGIRAAGPRPAALPRDIDDFTGRREQVETLTGMLNGDAPAVVVSAINGMAGVGKTTLAVHTARGLGDTYPDGQLYVDLRGADHDPADPNSVLGTFLRELGTEASDVPDGMAERVALFRSSLSERRVLLLLDNAASGDQVRPLIPGAAGCAVLVTSRAWLTGLEGARHMRLDVMPPEEALALLRRIIGDRRVDAEPQAAAELADACGALPLALRIAASRLAAEPGRSLADMVRLLTDERNRLAELRSGDAAVEAAFDLSYSKLTGEQSRAFRLLALLDVPDSGPSCAAALLGRDAHDPEDTEELLESLVDLSLLESRRPGRYHFHDLVRTFARARSAREDTPGETTRAFAGLLDFCVATARNADAVAHSVEPEERSLIDVPMTSPGLAFGTAQDATDWMREEIPVQRALVDRACEDDGLSLTQAADLMDKLNTVLSGITHLSAVAERAERVAGAAARRGSPDVEALARYVRGNALWHANSYAEAEPELARALELCAGGSARLRASAHLTLCANARVHGHFAEAVGHGEASVRLFRELGAEIAEGTALGELAFNYARQGRLAEARAAAERGAELVGGRESVSKAIGLYYLARVLRLCGDGNAALDRARAALEMFRALGVTAFEAATGTLMAEVHAEAGHHALAARTAEEFMPLARRTSGMLEGALLRALGRGLCHLRQGARARACLEAALDLFERRGATADAEQTRTLLAGLA
ncbi:AfsR/SARP family transcriptional regulator [Streptomyces hesseae]|uniref:BTAD domain-containing putative transcriptional regulator n=1 Tax=Streptomyces hesseae TaxID=3075519 RepID=A0ABU2SJW6_9ACTN|nr:BTAD domain-containing putative transcriptional regulator [Streptomyces sp. DSM 40473]MDT0449277.1 BTAD domain-containing putative transcriptional regulator [Streptomyces sp. DSM 40473]